MPRLLRSTSARLALGFGLAFAASALILVGVLWWATAGSLARQTDAVIREDAEALGQIYRDEGFYGLALAIGRRLDDDRGGGRLYLLAGRHLAPIAGNLAAWPLRIGGRSGWSDIEIVRGGEAAPARVLTLDLPDGQRLLVGRDLRERQQLRASVVGALIWWLAAALALAALLGLLLRRLFQARLRAIRTTAEAIAHGDIARRVPAADSDDEFDLLASTINEMLDRIQDLIADVRNVSNAIAHDLRTPLAELRSRLETLRQHQDDRPGLAAGIDDAVGDVDRLIAIFTALLRLVEIDSGTRRAGFAAVDLGTVVGDVGEFYAAVAEAKGIGFTVAAPPGLVVEGDRDLLSQALGNLIDNALKFTPPGGVVRVAVAPVGPAGAEITVADSGQGVAEPDLPKLTQRFYRADSSRHTPGIGLGLSLVQAVADLHRGTLDLANRDPGLNARLCLPRIAGSAASDRQADRLSTADSKDI
ncbi:MAG: HAMP domain-containing protein [Azospirillum sp.]|nr:HAMP domain-containing protein [Azospirillum sp.]